MLVQEWLFKESKENHLTVVSPIEDGPAYKAGIKPKDQIVEIDGESTYNLTSEEASKRLKGKANTSVKSKSLQRS